MSPYSGVRGGRGGDGTVCRGERGEKDEEGARGDGREYSWQSVVKNIAFGITQTKREFVRNGVWFV